MTALVDTGWLAARLDDPPIAAVKVDEDTTAYEKGHIVGAVALGWEHELRAAPRRDFVDADADALALLLGSEGISDGQTIVFYGGNNNWFAAYAWFVLPELLGYPQVRNYYGSWTEYGSLVDVPVEL